MVRFLAIVSLPMIVVIGWLFYSPPSTTPYWDCRIGAKTRTMDARAKLLTHCLKGAELNDEERSYIHFKRGTAYGVMGQLDRALADFDAALRIRPGYVDAFYNRGNTHREMGQIGQAITDFSRAIHHKPRDTESYYNRGLLLVRTGDHQGGIADFTSALSIKPDHFGAFLARGHGFIEAGQPERGIADLNEAIRLRPNDGRPYLFRAQAYLNLEDYDQAIDAGGEALRQARLHGLADAKEIARHLFDDFARRQHLADAFSGMSRRSGLARGSIKIVITAYEKILKGNTLRVTALQSFLKTAGHLEGEPSGIYDRRTVEAMVLCLAKGCDLPPP